jgi:hypothetical protein
METNWNKQLDRSSNNDETGKAQNHMNLYHVIQTIGTTGPLSFEPTELCTQPIPITTNHHNSSNQTNENQWNPIWTNSGSTSTNFNL